MGTNSSNLSSTSEIFEYVGFLNSVGNKSYIVVQMFGFMYTLVCVFWLVYVIYELIALIRNRKSLINLSYLNTEHDYKIRIFMHRESILRNSIFLVFLCFEVTYSLTINIFGITYTLLSYQDSSIPIAPNCTLDTGTFLALAYNNRFGIILLNMSPILGDLSFSMMIWLFGVSLFHLSFAARNELRVKAVLHYILLGLFINLILMAFVLIPYTRLFGAIAHSVIDQISILIAIYIAKRKFFPAMNSRIIDAFHYNNVRVYLEQKRLLYRYKVLICFLTFTFEIYILKNLILYNLYAIFESISWNPCWFHVTLHLPTFKLSQSSNNTLDLIVYYLSVIEHLTDIVVYINFILVNLTLIYCTTKIYFKRMFCKKKPNCYRYQVLSASLLPATK